MGQASVGEAVTRRRSASSAELDVDVEAEDETALGDARRGAAVQTGRVARQMRPPDPFRDTRAGDEWLTVVAALNIFKGIAGRIQRLRPRDRMNGKAGRCTFTFQSERRCRGARDVAEFPSPHHHRFSHQDLMRRIRTTGNGVNLVQGSSFIHRSREC